MIKENQRTLNYINVILDALLIFLCMPIAYWARFFLFPFDDRGITLRYYLILTLCMLPIFLITLGAMNLYDSLRTKRLHWEVGRLFWACSLGCSLYKAVNLRQKSQAGIAIFCLVMVVWNLVRYILQGW